MSVTPGNSVHKWDDGVKDLHVEKVAAPAGTLPEARSPTRGRPVSAARVMPTPPAENTYVQTRMAPEWG